MKPVRIPSLIAASFSNGVVHCRAALFAVAALALIGCAFTTGHVDLDYQPAGTAQKIATSDSPPVTVQVVDRRSTKVVGQKINGFGMKTADIVANNDVDATIKNALDTELSSRGFAQTAGGNTVVVDLDNLQNQFSIGLVSGDAKATAQMEVSVKRPDGSVAYDQNITGQAKDWIELATEGNAEKQLNAAIADAIKNLFNDPKFIDALKKA